MMKNNIIKFVSFPFIFKNGLYLNLLKKYNSYYNYLYNMMVAGRRFYSGVSNNNNDNLLNNQVNLNINSNYYSKNKLNNKNILKILKFLENNKKDNVELVFDESDLNNIKLLETRFNKNNFMNGYVLIESIHGINFMVDDFIVKFYEEIINDKINLNVASAPTIKNNSDLGDVTPGGTAVQGMDINIIDYKLKFNNILNSLNKGCVYKIIFRWQSIDVDSFGHYRTSFNTSPSFFIYHDMELEIVLYKFINYLNVITNKYSVSDKINLDIFIKEWISFDEFKSFDRIINTIKKSDKNYLQDKTKKVITSENNILDNNGFFDNDLVNNNNKFYFSLNVKGLNYGCLISNEDVIKYRLLSKLNISNDSNNVVLYKTMFKNNNYIIKVENKDNNINNVVIYLTNFDYKLNDNHATNLNMKFIDNIYLIKLEEWIDTISYQYDKNKELTIVERVSEDIGQNIKFINNELIKVGIIYNCKKLLSSYYDFDKDKNIGCIDIETYKNSNGDVVPYSIGFKTDDLLYTSYIDEFLSSDDMILNCIDKICISKNHNIKLYAHNMSEFDGIILLKSLIKSSDKHEYKIKIFSDNEGKILSIDISKKLKNKKIVKISILDSYLLLPVNLDELCKVFKTDVNKDIFPYEFISEQNLNYKGNVPDFVYFNKIKLEDYSKYIERFKNSEWDIKKETLKYLEKDLVGLYEVIMKFNNNIYNRFKINITRVRTISGLAFLIFNSKYYDENKNPIYFVKGKLEKFIRDAFIGGIVDVNTQYTDFLTYKYDVNSHYPFAMMMNPMPGGFPRISSEKNLDNIFGFVEAIVEAPSEEELNTAILPVKIEGKTVMFRGIERGKWWSEELKMAINYGYKIHKILTSVEFDRVEGIFTNFISDIYASKVEAESSNNMYERFIYKLILNSLFGRLGLRQQNFKLSLVDEKKIDKILHTENSDVLFKYNNLNLVRSSGPLDPELLQIINDEKLYDSNYKNINAPNPWGSNKSSVQYSAAITAYARMFLNQFKNMKDNLYLGGDTDSIIMSKPLDERFIGKGIGKFKLEHVIQEGFYHSKKFYLLKTTDNKIIIKAKGIDNSLNILNYQSFVELFKGNTITLKQIQFNKTFKTLDINISYIEKKIKGITNPEINYKMKNRNLILYDSKKHCLQPYTFT